MEKEQRITAPDGCEIEEVKIVNGVAVVKFREKERKPPKTWDEFCENYPVKAGEWYISGGSCFLYSSNGERECKAMLPDRATAEAILTLCQLIRLRNAYNGDWVPDWTDDTIKYAIEFRKAKIINSTYRTYSCSPVFFKSEELRDEFLRNFRPLIEKLKPLYGIKEGGEE